MNFMLFEVLGHEHFWIILFWLFDYGIENIFSCINRLEYGNIKLIKYILFLFYIKFDPV